MKIFKNETKNILYFAYRLVQPVIDPVRLFYGLTGYVWFARDLIRYKRMDPSAKLLSKNLFPILHEKVIYTPFDAHYFYQQLWAFEHIFKQRPKEHVDVGSTYEMSGYISKITKAVFVDIRPIPTSLKNLRVIKGDILELPFADGSIESLSCLSVAEHIGLGRYGDRLDPRGTRKACRELVRVLAKGGRLYFSVPVGKNRICFNAHRIHEPKTIVSYFSGLKLVEFCIVDDDGRFHERADYKKFSTLNYGCGLFLFQK